MTKVSPFFLLFAVLFILFITPWSLEAQTKTGAIRGRVTDAGTGQGIPGASVIISGTNKGVATDSAGNFLLSNLTPGPYQLNISMLTYKTFISEMLSLKAGQELVLDVKLVEEVSQLENIVVVASRPVGTDAGLIGQMRESRMVASGVSGQFIARTQDKDASEVVRRIPGISVIDDKFVIVRGLAQRYNNVWINGAAIPSSEADTRSFSFDIIPGSQIENMMIVKSPVPELPGDFAGGFVQIRTKILPDKDAFSVSYSTGFNTETHFHDFKRNPGSSTDFLGFDNGKRALRSTVPHRMDNADNALVDRVSKSGFNTDWRIKTGKPLPDQKLTLAYNRRLTDKEGNRYGIVAALNYSNTNKSLLDMENSRFGIYDNQNDQKVYLYKYTDNQYANDVRLGAMLNLSLTPQAQGGTTSRYEFRNIFNQLGRNRYTDREGYHVASGYYEQFQEEYLYASRTSYTGQFAGNHETGASHIDWNAAYSYSNRRQPDRRRVERQNDESNGITDYEIYQSSISRDFIKLDEHLASAAANLVHTFNKGGDFAPELRTGLYGEYKTRQYDTRAFKYKWNTEQNLPDGFAALPTEQIMVPGNMGIDKIHVQDESLNGDNYSADNYLAAAYAAINLPLGQVNVYAGARLEHFNTSITSYPSEVDFRTRQRNYTYTNLLPSMNATYSFTSKALLRLAYGMSVNRQEFRELSPSTYMDFDMFSLVMGNPDLKQAVIQNLDLRYELYPSSGEILSVALFYKHFKNPIEWTYTDGGGSYIYSFQNAASAYSYGAELDLRKDLAFMGLKNFMLSLNATWIKSQVKFDKESLEHDRPMQGQSPYLINAGLFYQLEKIGFSAAVLYNRIGKRIVGIGRVQTGTGESINNDIPDMYELPRDAMDLTLSQRLSKVFEIKASVRDIFAQRVEFRQFPTFIDSEGNKHRREQVTKSYKPGRSLSFTLTATF